MKRLLVALYSSSLTRGATSLAKLSRQLSWEPTYLKRLSERAEREGLITKGGGQYALTPKGRARLRVVMAGGVFNILHPGHVHTLSSSKRLGDVLVVSVATDKTVRKSRGGEPFTDERRRVQLVGSLRFVDVALLGSERSIFDTVAKVKPDIIALGYDQKHDEKALEQGCRERGLRPKIVRLSTPIPELKSSAILKAGDVTKQF